MEQKTSALGSIREDITRRIKEAILRAQEAKDFPGYLEPEIRLETPARSELGDFATGVAMSIAGELGTDGKQAAGLIVRHLSLEDSWIQRVDIAGPGFINFFLHPGWLEQAMASIWKEGPLYGRTYYGEGKKVLIEFVSANPTGPLNVVNARAAAVGDCLANLLETSGFQVSREYYINDAGRQTDLLALSFEARYKQAAGEKFSLPDGGYHGEYLLELAKDVYSIEGHGPLELEAGERHEWFKRKALAYIIEWQKKNLLDYGVKYDTWFSENELRDSGAHREIIDILDKRGFLYKQDGAVWFKSTQFGDDKDRVLVRSSGEETYIVPDLAYHKNKIERGYDLLVDILGPDHHGYVSRLSAGLQALGYPKEILEVKFVQTVRLKRGKEIVKMSKRGGDFVLMEELIDEVGKDACRFFFLDRSPESHLDFDLDLARLQSTENPVFYVQYAHARVASILRQARLESYVTASGPKEVKMGLLRELEEIQLMKMLAQFPEQVYESARAREPNRHIRYMTDLAAAFHVFYTKCRVLGEDKELTAARLYLVRLVQIVLANGLRIAGISAPDSM